MEFQVKIVGTEDLLNKIGRLKNFMTSPGLRAALEDAKDAYVLLAREGAPKSSRRLQASIHGQVEDFGSTNPRIRIGVGDEGYYARWLEFGTKPHSIQPRMKRILHWYTDGIRTVQVPYGLIGAEGLTSVFARRVQHPGMRAQPFFFKPMELIRGRMLMALERLLTSELSKK